MWGPQGQTWDSWLSALVLWNTRKCGTSSLPETPVNRPDIVTCMSETMRSAPCQSEQMDNKTSSVIHGEIYSDVRTNDMTSLTWRSYSGPFCCSLCRGLCRRPTVSPHWRSAPLFWGQRAHDKEGRGARPPEDMAADIPHRT